MFRGFLYLYCLLNSLTLLAGERCEMRPGFFCFGIEIQQIRVFFSR